MQLMSTCLSIQLYDAMSPQLKQEIPMHAAAAGILPMRAHHENGGQHVKGCARSQQNLTGLTGSDNT